MSLTKHDFSAEDWQGIVALPVEVSMYISLASPAMGDMFKVSMALVNRVVAVANDTGATGLLAEIGAEYKDKETLKKAQPYLDKSSVEAANAKLLESMRAKVAILDTAAGAAAQPVKEWLYRVALATDAIWRACRIVLDIRLHRGEISVPDAIAMLIRETGFERPNATAEVHRYTSTPTYQLSYLLGRELILRLRADEQRRLGADFSLKGFHDALLWSGSLPVSFHRRLLAGEGGGPFRPGMARPA